MHGVHVPQLPGFHDLTGALPLGMEAIHETLHDAHSPFLRVSDGILSLAGVKGERLLAQDVLACVRALLHPFRVHVVGKRDVDRLYFLVRQKLLIGAISPRDAELPGKRLSLVPGARGHRAHLHERGLHDIGMHAQTIMSGNRKDAPDNWLHLSPPS